MASSIVENYKTQKLMGKYGVAWFKFDESSGNVTDSKGTAVGTIMGVTRVVGWNGEGYALNFNGNDYVQFNQRVIPIGEKSIRFKIKRNGRPSTVETFMASSIGTRGYGIQFYISTDGKLCLQYDRGIQNNMLALLISTIDICDGNWHDVLFTWNGTTDANAMKIYIDDMVTPNIIGTALSAETTPSSYNLVLGAFYDTKYSYFFRGQFDDLEIYNKALTPNDLILNKTFILSDSNYMNYNSSTLQWESLLSLPTESEWLNQGSNVVTKDMLQQLATQNITGKIAIRRF